MKRILDAKFHCSKTPSYFLVIFISRFCKNSYLFWWCLKWIESKTKRNSTWWEKISRMSRASYIKTKLISLYLSKLFRKLSDDKSLTNPVYTVYYCSFQNKMVHMFGYISPKLSIRSLLCFGITFNTNSGLQNIFFYPGGVTP